MNFFKGLQSGSHEHWVVSNHRELNWLWNSLFSLTKTKYQIVSPLSLCKGNPPAIDWFSSHMDSNKESVLIMSWPYHRSLKSFRDIKLGILMIWSLKIYSKSLKDKLKFVLKSMASAGTPMIKLESGVLWNSRLLGLMPYHMLRSDSCDFNSFIFVIEIHPDHTTWGCILRLPPSPKCIYRHCVCAKTRH